MRLNNVGPLIVTPVEPRTEVHNTRAVDPVRAYTPGERTAEPPAPLPAREEAPAPDAPPEGERRRRSERRAEDRRKRQIPVLMDTRVADRRAASRRDEDLAPVHIDVEA